MKDVCEWRIRKSKVDGVYYSRTSCCTKTDRKPHESNNICPYCKKPIRVIEEEKDE
jgi:hypothetical protein